MAHVAIAVIGLVRVKKLAVVCQFVDFQDSRWCLAECRHQVVVE